MFTSVDKSLIAIIMAGLFLLNTFTGWDLGITEGTVNASIGVLTPILVYFVPNTSAE